MNKMLLRIPAARGSILFRGQAVNGNPLTLGAVLAVDGKFEGSASPMGSIVRTLRRADRRFLWSLDMSFRDARVLACALLAAGLSMFGPSAQATQYGVSFDPPPLDVMGLMKIDVDPSCLIPSNSDNPCNFDVLSLNFTDGLGRMWDIAGPEPGIGQMVRIDDAGVLSGVQVTIFDPQPVNFDNTCDGNKLIFALDGSVAFDCGGHPEASATGTVTSITLVPEPATLGLLGLGFAGIAVTRRRRMAT